MKWETIYKYVDQTTGEITETKRIWKDEIERIIIITKKEKNATYTRTGRITTITKHYQRNKYKQQTFEF